MKPLVYPADWLFRNVPPPINQVHRRILAEGDSWFTIGTLNLPAASNIPFKLIVKDSTIIINCAYPGHTLQHMVDWASDPYFDKLLCKPNFQMKWEAILISAGGNDLIDAARVLPKDEHGNIVPQSHRLFLTANEIDNNLPLSDPQRFMSQSGWNTFEKYLRANFVALVARRDKGINKNVPILLHTYASPVVRPSGTPLNSDGWLYPSLKAYGIVNANAQAVSKILFERLRQLLLSLNDGQPNGLSNVHVFDSAGVNGIDAADPTATGSSGHWVNEIHLTPEGYAKIGVLMGPWLEAIVP